MEGIKWAGLKMGVGAVNKAGAASSKTVWVGTKSGWGFRVVFGGYEVSQAQVAWGR